jgi:microcystin-dependent protein
MALESATYINGLVPTNPLGNDPKSQGDDHVRLIKSTLKNTFPNVTGAVTVTQDQINAIGTPGVINFSGMVVGFTGTQAQIPSGWQLCNGVGNTALGPVPDLRQKFIIGSTGDTGALPTDSTGGSSTHNHAITVNNHVLTVNQIPAHRHYMQAGQLYSTKDEPPNSPVNNLCGDPASDVRFTSTATMQSKNYITETGGGQGHNHTATSGNASSLPPYYALAFIVKL